MDERESLEGALKKAMATLGDMAQDVASLAIILRLINVLIMLLCKPAYRYIHRHHYNQTS